MGMKKKVKRTKESILDTVFGGGRKKKKTDAEREKEIKEQVAQQADRIRNIKSILEEIDFSESELPPEELGRKTYPKQSVSDYELARKLTIQYLDRAKATEMDTSKIDECIRYAANTFSEGVKYGQLNKAKYSTVALLYLVQYERTDVDETDLEMSEAMRKKKEAHAEMYVTMLKLCKKLDNRERRKAKLAKSYERSVEELEKKRLEFNELRDTDEGALAWMELEKNADHPINLSMMASELDNLVSVLSRKDSSILILKAELREINRQLVEIQGEMEEIQNHLSKEVYVEDPDLQSRISEIYNDIGKDIAEIQNENKRMEQEMETHQSVLMRLLDSPESAKTTAKNLAYVERKEQEEEQKRRDLEELRAKRIKEKQEKIAAMKKRKEQEILEQNLDQELSEQEQDAWEESYEDEYTDESVEEEHYYNEY